jgi:LacI family transcriptional regulator
MTDVAKKAGVSQTTASFVLNNRQDELRISERTRQRVLKAAQELGYRRNELARAVGSGKNFVIGFAKEEDVYEVQWRILDGVLEASNQSGYLLKVLSRARGDADYVDLVGHCVEQRLAGLIARTYTNPDTTEALRRELAEARIPIVFVDDLLELNGAACVASDDVTGCRQAVGHLVALGHRDIAVIGGDRVHPQSVFRTDTFVSVLKENGIKIRHDWIQVCDWEIENTERITSTFINDLNDYPTAIICPGDAFAATVMQVMIQAGLRIPQDVSVIGFADFSFAKLLSPPLTTIAQPFEEIGRTATKLLLGQLSARNNVEIPGLTMLPTELIVRGSTGVVRRKSEK